MQPNIFFKDVSCLSYCPLQIWPLKTCNKDISKILTASSLKLGQLIEDRLPGEITKKVILFFMAALAANIILDLNYSPIRSIFKL